MWRSVCPAPHRSTSGRLRRETRTVELELDGYRGQRCDVGLRRNWWALGNVVTLGLGMFIDVALAGTSR